MQLNKTSYKNYDRILVNSMFNSAVQDQKSNYAVNSFYDITAAGINGRHN